jgi:hypothetical protein
VALQMTAASPGDEISETSVLASAE